MDCRCVDAMQVYRSARNADDWCSTDSTLKCRNKRAFTPPWLFPDDDDAADEEDEEEPLDDDVAPAALAPTAPTRDEGTDAPSDVAVATTCWVNAQYTYTVRRRYTELIKSPTQRD